MDTTSVCDLPARWWVGSVAVHGAWSSRSWRWATTRSSHVWWDVGAALLTAETVLLLRRSSLGSVRRVLEGQAIHVELLSHVGWVMFVGFFSEESLKRANVVGAYSLDVGTWDL